jgi:branched-subunit amino acid aminotransferase/4-amino-4-deoxychorismate lyase
VSAAVAWCDGAWVVAVPRAERGAFETMGARAGELPLWPRHLARLARAAERLGVAFVPPPDLELTARELLARTGQRDGILRLELAVVDGAARWSMTARARPSAGGPVRLAPVEMPPGAADRDAGFKSTARGRYEEALAQARAAGADEALLVDAAGWVLEAANANVLALVRGAPCTPPLDGRIVPGIARALLLEGLAARGTPMRERALHRDELREAAGVWITNAVHGARVAILDGAILDGGRAPGAEAAAWTSRLAEIWAAALGGT